MDSTPEEIDAYHRTLQDSYGNLWPGIGYHMVVRQDGRIYYVGDARTKRANVYGRNHEVFGIVLTGDFSKFYPLPLQLTGARRAIRFARTEIGSSLPVVGHRDLALLSSPTACPGASWEGWRAEVTQ